MLRDILINDCETIGVGGTATVYRLDDGRALKLFHEGMLYDDVRHEYEMTEAAFRLGMPVPEPYEVVSAGKRYGIITECIQGDTLSNLLTQHPERTEEYGVKMATLFRQLHSTHVPSLPNVHKETAKAIRRIEYVIGAEGVDILMDTLNSIPQGDSLLHCDLHPRNVMTDGKRYTIIDVGEIGYGNPLIDLSNTHALMTSGLLDFKRFVGFPKEYAAVFWDTLLRNYLNNPPQDEYESFRMQLDSLCRIRCFTWMAKVEGLPAEVTDRFRKAFVDMFMPC